MDSIKNYFEFLDSRIEEKRSCNSDSIVIRICGRVIRINFTNLMPDRVMYINLKNLTIEESGLTYVNIDEEVFVWEDCIDDIAPPIEMIPMESREMHFHQRPEYKFLFPGTVKRQASRDIRRSRTYVTFETGHVYPESYINKPFVNEMQWWLEDKYYLMHSACVGYKGKTAMITAPSGKGKSTLALSGLISGMEYLCEDYMLVSKEGEIVGYSIFPTGFLLSDTLEMLPELKSEIIYFDENRQKYLVDLSRFGKCFRESMKISCFIYPEVTDNSEPVISKNKDAFLFMQAIRTTAKQITADKYSDYIMKLFLRFKNMPSYRFDLTKDTMKNAEYLKVFLENLENE